MTPAAAGRMAERRNRIEEERRRRPESADWLRLLDLALAAAEDPAWSRLEPRLPPDRQADAPLLHDAFVAVDRRAARRWVRSALRTAADSTAPAAASLAGLRGRALDPLELLAAAASEDAAALEDIARRGDADLAALTAVARIAVLPLLWGCAAALGSGAPTGWSKGYCPVCGGWPAVAELRGLERTRVLRCARCATGWELPVLVCPFCDERDHHRHYSFAAEGEEQRRRVDACRGCNGYVKAVTTLAPIRDWAVPLEDLATVELDIVARDRGLRPPDAPARPVDVRVVAEEGAFARLTGGWA